MARTCRSTPMRDRGGAYAAHYRALGRRIRSLAPADGFHRPFARARLGARDAIAQHAELCRIAEGPCARDRAFAPGAQCSRSSTATAAIVESWTLSCTSSSALRLNTCVIHPFDLAARSAIKFRHGCSCGQERDLGDAGLAPHLVRRRLIASAGKATEPAHLASMIFDRGVSFPWRTDDDRLAKRGVIGNPKGASAELGHVIVESVIAQTRAVLAQLLENPRGARSAREQRRAPRRGSPARTSRRSGSRRQRRPRKSS